jgi:hypothetical protein
LTDIEIDRNNISSFANEENAAERKISPLFVHKADNAPFPLEILRSTRINVYDDVDQEYAVQNFRATLSKLKNEFVDIEINKKSQRPIFTDAGIEELYGRDDMNDAAKAEILRKEWKGYQDTMAFDFEKFSGRCEGFNFDAPKEKFDKYKQMADRERRKKLRADYIPFVRGKIENLYFNCKGMIDEARLLEETRL